MVEGTPLLRAQTSKGSRGFESLPLRQFSAFLLIFLTDLPAARRGRCSSRVVLSRTEPKAGSGARVRTDCRPLPVDAPPPPALLQ